MFSKDNVRLRVIPAIPKRATKRGVNHARAFQNGNFGAFWHSIGALKLLNIHEARRRISVELCNLRMQRKAVGVKVSCVYLFPANSRTFSEQAAERR
jgi:hypothetical protein